MKILIPDFVLTKTTRSLQDSLAGKGICHQVLQPKLLLAFPTTLWVWQSSCWCCSHWLLKETRWALFIISLPPCKKHTRYSPCGKSTLLLLGQLNPFTCTVLSFMPSVNCPELKHSQISQALNLSFYHYPPWELCLDTNFVIFTYNRPSKC